MQKERVVRQQSGFHKSPREFWDMPQSNSPVREIFLSPCLLGEGGVGTKMSLRSGVSCSRTHEFASSSDLSFFQG